MSWSVYAIGTPENVCKKIDETLNAYSPGQSHDEFAAAAPSLKSLVAQNFAKPEKADWIKGVPMLKLEAQGSGTVSGGEEICRSCTVKIEVLTPNC